MLWTLLLLLISATTVIIHDERFRFVPLEGDGARVDVLARALVEDDLWLEGGRGEVERVAGRVRIASESRRHTPFLRRHISPPQGATAVRVAVAHRATDIVAGEHRRPRAAIYLVALDDREKPRWSGFGDVAASTEDAPTRRSARTYSIPSDTEKLMLGIHLIAVSGSLEVSGLQLDYLRDRAAFTVVRDALFAFWALAVVWGCWLFLRRADRPLIAAVGIGAGAVGSVFLLLPKGTRDALLAVPGQYGTLFSDVEALGNDGHTVLFLILGVLARLAYPSVRVEAIGVPLVVLAGSAEIAQILTYSRSPALEDGLRNAAGLLIGLFVAAVAQFLVTRTARARRRHRTRTRPASSAAW